MKFNSEGLRNVASVLNYPTDANVLGEEDAPHLQMLMKTMMVLWLVVVARVYLFVGGFQGMVRTRALAPFIVQLAPLPPPFVHVR